MARNPYRQCYLLKKTPAVEKLQELPYFFDEDRRCFFLLKFLKKMIKSSDRAINSNRVLSQRLGQTYVQEKICRLEKIMLPLRDHKSKRYGWIELSIADLSTNCVFRIPFYFYRINHQVFIDTWKFLSERFDHVNMM